MYSSSSAARVHRSAPAVASLVLDIVCCEVWIRHEENLFDGSCCFCSLWGAHARLIGALHQTEVGQRRLMIKSCAFQIIVSQSSKKNPNRDVSTLEVMDFALLQGIHR